MGHIYFVGEFLHQKTGVELVSHIDVCSFLKAARCMLKDAHKSYRYL